MSITEIHLCIKGDRYSSKHERQKYEGLLAEFNARGINVVVRDCNRPDHVNVVIMAIQDTVIDSEMIDAVCQLEAILC